MIDALDVLLNALQCNIIMHGQYTIITITMQNAIQPLTYLFCLANKRGHVRMPADVHNMCIASQDAGCITNFEIKILGWETYKGVTLWFILGPDAIQLSQRDANTQPYSIIMT